jgi:hypothetical protein
VPVSHGQRIALKPGGSRLLARVKLGAASVADLSISPRFRRSDDVDAEPVIA